MDKDARERLEIIKKKLYDSYYSDLDSTLGYDYMENINNTVSELKNRLEENKDLVANRLDDIDDVKYLRYKVTELVATFKLNMNMIELLVLFMDNRAQYIQILKDINTASAATDDINNKIIKRLVKLLKELHPEMKDFHFTTIEEDEEENEDDT